MQAKIHQGQLKATGFRFAIIESTWNDFLTSKLTEGALNTLVKLGATEKNIEIFKVPGSFELPLAALKVALTGNFDAVICIGVVIRGETPHFEFVAGEAARGIAQAGMQSGIPVLFGVITADTLEQALNRAGIKAGNKGVEAANAAVEVVNLHKGIDGGKKSSKRKKSFPHVV
ncbi:MAG: 6,7-dimethyl-8-ribityllumazine synthase [Pyrinomonadaceae bacterium]|nr:6,7-dimethyl-8-ribityllumazine synthase [Pyrinomonadaceae bacterium]